MAWAIEAYQAQGAIALAQIYSFDEMQTLINQTIKLRRDPAEHKAEIDREETERFVDEQKSTLFTSDDGDSFSFGEFFGA